MSRLRILKEAEPLAMWTVYDHPSDYPGHYVARRWLIERGRDEPTWTDQVVVATTLARLREHLCARSLVALPRSSGDDSCIVETWL